MEHELVKVTEASARGGFFLILGAALSTIIMAVSSILIGRLLGPELYGQYTLALVAPQLLYYFTDLGINNGIIKFTAGLRSKGEGHRVPAIIKYGLEIRVLIGLAIFIINFAFAEAFASTVLQRPDLALYVRIASISIVFQVIYTTTTSAFVGLDKTEYNALASNVQAIAKALMSIALVLAGFSVAGAIIGYTAGYIVAAIAGLAILLNFLNKNHESPKTSSIHENLKILLAYGLPLYISVLINSFIPLYKNIMLAIFATDADVGNFKAAANFTTLMLVITVSITTNLLPAFSKLNSNRNVKVFYKLANKYTAMIVIPITFLLIILSKDIMEVVYGYMYQSAPIILSHYALIYLLTGLGFLTLPSLFSGLGETKINLEMSLITFSILAFLSPALTSAYSVQGLIASYLIAVAASTIYGLYIARKNFQIGLDIKPQLRIYINSALSTFPLLLMLNLTHLPKILNIIFGGLLYLFTYVTLTPLTKTVTAYELEATANITQKIQPLAVILKPILNYEQKLLQIKAKL
jgi:O-antigen/teichoic acid export membrane protein